MAAKEFIKYFENSSEISHDSFFKREFFICSTPPTKNKISHAEHNIGKIVSQMRNEILNNFRSNPEFMKNASKFENRFCNRFTSY